MDGWMNEACTVELSYYCTPNALYTHVRSLFSTTTSDDERKSFGFGTTWGGAINYRIFIWIFICTFHMLVQEIL